MAERNSIDVTVHPVGSPREPVSFKDVQFVSLVNHETYGIPALITEDYVKEEANPVRILYVNPENCVAIEAVRKS